MLRRCWCYLGFLLKFSAIMCLDNDWIAFQSKEKFTVNLYFIPVVSLKIASQTV